MLFHSYAAIGDSFTEGVGDDLPDGSTRGWADFVALGLARAAAPDPVRYANLAIRGRKLGPIIDEQLEAAIALRPEVAALLMSVSSIVVATNALLLRRESSRLETRQAAVAANLEVQHV